MTNTHPRFADLLFRQKMIVIIFSIVFGFALPASSTQAAQNTKTPVPPNSPPAVKVPPSAPAKPAKGQPTADITLPPTTFTAQQDLAQTKYVSALNELQMLKIQKEIAETSQAIVTAKLATVTAEKNITDVLSEPSKSATKESAPPPPSSTNLAPGGPGAPGAEGGPASYSVHSVSMEQDQWHAVVKYKSQFYDVAVGDMLPPDGSIVKAIDQKGVTLETAGFEQKIPLTITTSVPHAKSENSGNPEVPPPSAGGT